MQYRRVFVPGGSYFFTLVTERRRQLFIDEATVNLLRQGFRQVKLKRQFEIDAVVVLPDHLHCIWTLPAGDNDFSTRWRLIKTWFTKHYDQHDVLKSNFARRNKKQHPIWQHRFWEHVIRDQQDFERHVDYIHYNPVKHGYVNKPCDWPYSSFRRYVEQGILPMNWGESGMDLDLEIGNE